MAVHSIRGIELRAEARADVARPGASLLKLPLVAAVHAAARQGHIDLSARVSRARLEGTAYASMTAALAPGHELAVRELCALCLITSDNPIANFLLQLVGKTAVNDLALELGCENTRIEIGFEDEYLGEAGRVNVTTAHDALRLVGRLVPGDEEISRALANSLRNTRIPLRLPDLTRAPHKTGTLPGVVNDVGVVFGERTDFAIAFLCDQQADSALASIEIGDCVARIRRSLGESVSEQAPP